MSYVLSNIPCKEQDRRGIICVALRQAIEAPAKPAMAAGSGVDVAGRAYYETALSDLSIASNNIRFSEAKLTLRRPRTHKPGGVTHRG